MFDTAQPRQNVCSRLYQEICNQTFGERGEAAGELLLRVCSYNFTNIRTASLIDETPRHFLVLGSFSSPPASVE